MLKAGQDRRHWAEVSQHFNSSGFSFSIPAQNSFYFPTWGMDPVSLMASLVGVLTTANSVITFCIRLHGNAARHQEEVKKLTTDIQGLRNVLELLASIASAVTSNISSEKGSDQSSSNFGQAAKLNAFTLLCGKGGALAMCQKDLTSLLKILEKQSSRGNATDGLLRTLGWSRAQEDIKELLDRLERQKTIFNLALSVDEV
jgi:hypothetical protein